ncbi:MAG: AAA family ATPase [Nitrospinota bacterium]|nr:AAA family ATPase [Nitrospinota bacterium]
MIYNLENELLTHLDGVKQGAEAGSWTAKCPAHDDQHASLSIAIKPDGKTLVNCFTGCKAESIMGALGLPMTALFPPKEEGICQPAQTFPTSRLTVDKLAAHKKLPVDYLRSRFSLRDSDRGVIIPYYKADGSIFRERLRTALKAKDGSSWLPGTGQTAYVLNTKQDSATQYAVLCEGESDVWAGAYHGLPMIGIPGANAKKVLTIEHLAGIDDVFIIHEPDTGGDTFANELPAHLRAIGFTGGIYEIRMPDELKDLADLHSKYPDLANGSPSAFDINFGKCVAQARPLETDTVTANGKLEPEIVDQRKAILGDTLRIICFADIEPESIKWLYPGRFALGKVSVLVGDPGLGKSFITTDMAAHVSTGRAWPDETPCPMGEVIIANAEDDPADTIRPRLDAAGADVTKIHFLECVMTKDEQGRPAERFFTLRDIPALEAMLAESQNIILVSIDPVSAFMADTDSHKNSDVRGLIAPLSKLAGKYGVAVILVSHKNKSNNGGAAINRIIGSIGMGAAARAVWGVEKDSDDPERRILGPLKNNIGKDSGCLAYRLESVGESARIVWEPAVNIDFDALVLGMNERTKPEQIQAAEWLEVVLKDGPMKANEIYDLAKSQGIYKRTLNRAKTIAGVKSVKSGFDGGWQWELSSKDANPSEESEGRKVIDTG